MKIGKENRAAAKPLQLKSHAITCTRLRAIANSEWFTFNLHAMLNETRITSFTLAGIIQSETPISPLRSHMFFIFGIIFIKNLKGSPLCSFSLLKSVRGGSSPPSPPLKPPLPSFYSCQSSHWKKIILKFWLASRKNSLGKQISLQFFPICFIFILLVLLWSHMWVACGSLNDLCLLVQHFLLEWMKKKQFAQ